MARGLSRLRQWGLVAGLCLTLMHVGSPLIVGGPGHFSAVAHAMVTPVTDPVVVLREDFENDPRSGPIPVSEYQAHTPGLAYKVGVGHVGCVTAWDPKSQAPGQPIDCLGKTPKAESIGERSLGLVSGKFSGGADELPNRALVLHPDDAEVTGGTIPLKTVPNVAIAPLDTSRFLNFQAKVAVSSCRRNAADYEFLLRDSADEMSRVGSTAQLCGARGPVNVRATTGMAGTIVSRDAQLVQGGTVGFEIHSPGSRRRTQSSLGVDDVIVQDVTPQLSVTSDAPIDTGTAATITFTVTNTSEVGRKSGFSFVSILPPAAFLVGNAEPRTTCASGRIDTGDEVGNSRVVLHGGLKEGQIECTFTLELGGAGPVENPEVLELSGLDFVGGQVRRGTRQQGSSLDVDVVMAGERFTDSDQFVIEVRKDSSTGDLVSNPAWTTTAGAGGDVSKGTGSTGLIALEPSSAYWISLSPSRTAEARFYRQFISCQDGAQRQPGLPTERPLGRGLELRKVEGSAINCTITNIPVSLALQLDQSVDSMRDTDLNGKSDPGDTLAYAYSVTNVGELLVSNLVIVDRKVGAVVCPRNSLNPGESMLCQGHGVHVITRRDARTGVAVGVARAVATVPVERFHAPVVQVLSPSDESLWPIGLPVQ